MVREGEVCSVFGFEGFTVLPVAMCTRKEDKQEKIYNSTHLSYYVNCASTVYLIVSFTFSSSVIALYGQRVLKRCIIFICCLKCTTD